MNIGVVGVAWGKRQTQTIQKYALQKKKRSTNKDDTVEMARVGNEHEMGVKINPRARIRGWSSTGSTGRSLECVALKPENSDCGFHQPPQAPPSEIPSHAPAPTTSNPNAMTHS